MSRGHPFAPNARRFLYMKLPIDYDGIMGYTACPYDQHVSVSHDNGAVYRSRYPGISTYDKDIPVYRFIDIDRNRFSAGHKCEVRSHKYGRDARCCDNDDGYDKKQNQSPVHYPSFLTKLYLVNR
jgi:hypothetical protein